jgi:ribosomal protein S18 acetylase RimI-like enzyme
MTRRRIAVALVCPPRLARGFDDLRRMLGDHRIGVIGPHITLVPPVNVNSEDVANARALVRAAAVSAPPLRLWLGPAASFAPATPTIHLAVSEAPLGGEGSGQLRGHESQLGAHERDLLANMEPNTGALAEWRDSLFVGPLSRRDDRPYVPHVTLLRSADDHQIASARDTLVEQLGPWNVDRLHLLEHGYVDGGSRWWIVAEEPFGGPEISGRGGVELATRAIGVMEPDVAEMLGRSDLAGAVAGSDPGKNLLVVSERHGEPNQPVAVSIGTVDGQTARLEGVVVRPEDQGQGIGRRSLLAWCSAAADRGADAVVASLRLDDDELLWRGLLEGCGFGITGDLAIRRP